MDLSEIRRAGDTIRAAMEFSRKLERFLMGEHGEHQTFVAFADIDGWTGVYCALCRILLTPASGEEPVRFDGSRIRPD